jgi:hypothetical protein
MPRSILLRPPGGASGKVRKRYAFIQELMLLEESNCLRGGSTMDSFIFVNLLRKKLISHFIQLF